MNSTVISLDYNSDSLKVMIVTGEASGDMHGANLIKAMKDIHPGLSVCGMGGEALISQGMEPLYDGFLQLHQP